MKPKKLKPGKSLAEINPELVKQWHPTQRKPNKMQHFEGELTTRSENAILNFGLKKKEEVKKAIENRIFNINTVDLMGPKSFREICIWCGVFIKEE